MCTTSVLASECYFEHLKGTHPKEQKTHLVAYDKKVAIQIHGTPAAYNWLQEANHLMAEIGFPLCIKSRNKFPTTIQISAISQ
jgi:hypothetical protein